MKFTAIAPKMTIKPATIKAGYSHKKQASRIAKIYPSKLQIALTAAAIVITAVLWSLT